MRMCLPEDMRIGTLYISYYKQINWHVILVVNLVSLVGVNSSLRGGMAVGLLTQSGFTIEVRVYAASQCRPLAVSSEA